MIEERAVQIIGDYVKTVAQSKEESGNRKRPSLTGGRLSVPPKDPSEIRAVPTINDIEALSDDDEDDHLLKPASTDYLRKSLGDSFNGSGKIKKGKGRKK